MWNDLGLLILRAAFGFTMAFSHGLDKLMNYGTQAAQFPDPLGVGHEISMALTIFAEFACALSVGAGFLTRLTAIPIAITMLVAFGFIHMSDPWATKEAAFLYFAAFMCVILLGPGKYSADALLFKKKKR
jgi:putative oxidoreductase